MLIVFHQKIFIFFNCTPPLAMERESVLIGILKILRFNLLHQKKKDKIELPSFLDFGVNKLEKDGLKIKS
jgi:hypothetical protein